jgi:hypothetical protein
MPPNFQYFAIHLLTKENYFTNVPPPVIKFNDIFKDLINR